MVEKQTTGQVAGSEGNSRPGRWAYAGELNQLWQVTEGEEAMNAKEKLKRNQEQIDYYNKRIAEIDIELRKPFTLESFNEELMAHGHMPLNWYSGTFVILFVIFFALLVHYY